jgi:HK97 gp10 family phage protein
VRVIVDAHEVHDLASDLRGAGAYVEERAPLVVSKVGHDMQATTMVNAPVDTGHLRASVSLDVVGLGFDLGPTAEYGEYVELGTSRMAAEPYAGPAFDQELPTIIDALADAGARIL